MARTVDPEIRERLLDAAEQLASGRADFSLDAIARKAAVSRSSLYRRFPDRAALVKALVQERSLSSAALTSGLRDKIIAATGAELIDVGLHAATIERIAERADVGVATVYRHFANKEALLRTFFAVSTPRRMVAKLTDQPVGDLHEALREIATAALGFAQQYGGLLMLALSPDPETAAWLAKIRSGNQSTHRYLTDFFAEQTLPPHLANIAASDLATAFFGLVITFARIGPLMQKTPTHPPEQAAEIIVGLFLGGSS